MRAQISDGPHDAVGELDILNRGSIAFGKRPLDQRLTLGASE